MKINAIYIILAGILAISCSTYRKIPSPVELPVSVNGMYCKVKHDKQNIATGEIIVVDSAKIVLLGDSTNSHHDKVIIPINKADLDSVYVYIASTTNDPEAVLAWASLMPLLSISQGEWAVISLPVNLLVSCITIYEVTGKYYGFMYPKDISWEDLSKFARFPQGWPEGVSPGDIK